MGEYKCENSFSSRQTEIREAWLKLSMLHHPDLNKDNEAAKEKKMREKAEKELVTFKGGEGGGGGVPASSEVHNCAC